LAANVFSSISDRNFHHASWSNQATLCFCEALENDDIGLGSYGCVRLKDFAGSKEIELLEQLDGMMMGCLIDLIQNTMTSNHQCHCRSVY
jgi:hypothetical protein